MGVPAAERCDDFGWHPRGKIDPTLVAEIAERPRFGVGHAWSKSAGYSLTTAPERIYAVMPMEGGFEFSVDGTPTIAEAGSLVLFDGAAPTTARTLTDTARFVWYLEPTFLQAGRSRFRYGEPIGTGGSATNALISMTNALVDAPDTPSSHGVNRHLALAFENLLSGVLEEAGPDVRHTAEHRDGLFMTALASIEVHFRDPAFSVTRLAKDVATSPRTLHNAFARLGTTPRRELERRRITEANQLAEQERISVTDLAARAGFTSTRQLARAFNRNSDNAGTLPDQQ